MLQGPILRRVAAVLSLGLAMSACSADPIIREGQLAAPTSAAPASSPTEPAIETEGASPAETAPVDGFQFVDPAQVAALFNDCESGSDMACDVLFAASDFGSDEESTALSCAGRSDRDVVFCTDGLEPDGDELWFDPTSPALDRITDACEGGDMTACDLLYFRSPVGSSFEDLGRGCGGRVVVVFPDCRTAFPE